MLSHHESHVLAVVRKWQPTTAYFVRKALPKSLASTFSDSPGSVYPVIERLKKRGLVVARQLETDGRKTESLSCSPEGEAAVLAWLQEENAADLLPEDPWRTRMIFSDLLPPEARLAWLRRWRALAEEQRASIVARSGLPVDDAHADALENARLVTEARIVWLERLIAGTVTG